ncbi:SEC-C metal-binding domain-containing protein [Photobacterium sanguinicancri]|uniref:SEC-C metal-binding domain-containing protein n=1 Tax=Photobacterium sanguinicancri TaxID=875932 RepID=UPI0026E22B72|nr:SEC-C metal-binding domain-containing protein [Photobacterium sanguinicancri]MDO6501213.1 SEC-C metal-binding domain-containing protein [Photobacterium sanguinicancri]
MPAIPAFCDTCGTAFPSGFFMENCTDISLRGCKSGPCPKCGGQGSVPDGVFNVIGNVIEILDAPRKTIEQLTKYSKVLHEARANNLSREEVKAKIDKEVPELSGISSYLPKTRTELYAFLTLLLTFFATVSPLLKDSKESPDINLIINNTVEQVISQQGNKSVQQESKPEIKFERPSRNELCYCGSDKKYKNCCGEVI